MTTTANELALKKLVTARVQLLMNKPFWGQLAMRLQWQEADKDWCPTAGTDGVYFYYNPEFINKLTLKEAIFVCAHEVEHCIYDHMSRRGNRDPRMWNCANDFVVNLELQDHKVGDIPNIGVLVNNKFRDMSSEEVFEILKKDPNFAKGNQNSFDLHLEPKEGEGEEEGEEGEEGCTPGGTPGSGSGKGKSNGSGDKPAKGPARMSKEDRERLSQEFKQAVVQAAKQNMGAGGVPAGVCRMVKEFTEPQMDWREILQATIQSCHKNDFTWMRPNRKTQAMGIHLPSMTPDFMIDVAIAVDTSGSIGHREISDFLGEVKGIMEQFNEFRIRIWCFDSAAYEVQEFTQDNLMDIDDFKISGGGGTTFEVNWDLMKEQEIMPHKFIMMTDGYPCGGWGDEVYCDTVFLIHGDVSKKIQAPFGTTCHYEPASN